MTQTSKINFEKITELLKVIIWPVIVIFILLLYYSDIKSLIQNSTKVSVGTFSMEIMKEAKNQGFSELGQTIANLEEDELRTLLTIAESGRYGLIGRNNDEYFLSERSDIWENLEKQSLVEFENFNLKDVKEFMLKIGAKKTTIYYNEDGVYTNQKTSEFHIKSEFYDIKTQNISETNKRKLESYSIVITEKGKRSIDIIVKTVIDELKK